MWIPSSSSSSSSSSAAAAGAGAAAGSIPHILLLITDQFRYDAFDPVITPNLWNLVKKRQQQQQQQHPTTTTSSSSLYFENAYSSTPTCTPARAGLLTGKSPWSHGMLGYSIATNCTKYETTLPRILHETMNYTTVAVGKNHFGQIKHIHGYQQSIIYDGLSWYNDDYDDWFQRHHHDNGDDPRGCNFTGWNTWKGIEYCYDTYDHPTSWTTRQAMKVLQNHNHNHNNNNNPLFLKVSYHRPHSPYDPPKEIWDEFRLVDGKYSNLTQLQRKVNDTSWDIQYKNRSMENNDEAYAGDPGSIGSRISRSAYLANVHFVDSGIGQILNYLQQKQQQSHDDDNNNNNNNNNINIDNFLIIWVADHGDMNGDHYLWRKGMSYEASSHIPFLVKLPKDSLLVAPPSETTSSSATDDDDDEKKKEKETHQRVSMEEEEEEETLMSRRATSTTSTVSTIKTSKALVEIRDVAVTIYDVVGILPYVQSIDPKLDGKSLLPILQGTQKNVRNILDLEHSRVYGEFYWNALIGYDDNDGGLLYKYIFNAIDGSEQLFCLSNDPNEWYDLATTVIHENNTTAASAAATTTKQLLDKWRQKMVDQFIREGRDERWVKDGILQKRKGSITFGPNYPCFHDQQGEGGEVNA